MFLLFSGTQDQSQYREGFLGQTPNLWFARSCQQLRFTVDLGVCFLHSKFLYDPWESKTKQSVVFRMIPIKDSLLPMGKVWSLDFLGYIVDSFRSDSDSPKKNSQNKVTPRHTPVYRAACRYKNCILSESIFSIIYTDTFNIGLETYWKMIPPQPKKNHSQDISRLSPLHWLHTQPQLSTLRGAVHSHRNHQQSSTYWAVLPQVARLGPCGSGEILRITHRGRG